MKNNNSYIKFLDLIKEKEPERGKLASFIMNLLDIEKEAVYRRLRNEVPFSFSEISRISIALGISLDKIVDESNPTIHNLSMRTIEFIDPTESDFVMLERFAENAHLLIHDLDSVCGSVSNMIPVALSIPYKNIYKLYFYKWVLQFGNAEQQRLKYKDVKVNEKLIEINIDYAENMRRAPYSIYIFDRNFLHNLVKDTLYFVDTQILTKEEVMSIQNDLFLFIQNLEKITRNGRFDEGGKLDIYLSNVSFDTNYNFQYTNNYKLTMIRAFSYSDAYSLDERIYKNTMRWINFLKKKSTAISETGEIERITFFNMQRKIIKSLVQ